MRDGQQKRWPSADERNCYSLSSEAFDQVPWIRLRGALSVPLAQAIGCLRKAAAVRVHLETAGKLLSLLEGTSAIVSKRALKALNNQAGFDSAIRILIRCDQRGSQSLDFVTH